MSMATPYSVRRVDMSSRGGPSSRGTSYRSPSVNRGGKCAQWIGPVRQRNGLFYENVCAVTLHSSCGSTREQPQKDHMTLNGHSISKRERGRQVRRKSESEADGMWDCRTKGYCAEYSQQTLRAESACDSNPAKEHQPLCHTRRRSDGYSPFNVTEEGPTGQIGMASSSCIKAEANNLDLISISDNTKECHMKNGDVNTERGFHDLDTEEMEIDAGADKTEILAKFEHTYPEKSNTGVAQISDVSFSSGLIDKKSPVSHILKKSGDVKHDRLIPKYQGKDCSLVNRNGYLNGGKACCKFSDLENSIPLASTDNVSKQRAVKCFLSELHAQKIHSEETCDCSTCGLSSGKLLRNCEITVTNTQVLSHQYSPTNKNKCLTQCDIPHSPLRDLYVREIEALRSQLSDLKGAEGKRIRQKSESETSSAGLDNWSGGEPKRPRDISPKVITTGASQQGIGAFQVGGDAFLQQQKAVQCDPSDFVDVEDISQVQTGGMARDGADVEDISKVQTGGMVYYGEADTTKDKSSDTCEGVATPDVLLDELANEKEEEEEDATSLSTVSDMIDSDVSFPSDDEDDINQLDEEPCAEDDQSILSSLTNASSGSNTPSVVGETLGAICLTEQAKENIDKDEVCITSFLSFLSLPVAHFTSCLQFNLPLSLFFLSISCTVLSGIVAATNETGTIEAGIVNDTNVGTGTNSGLRRVEFQILRPTLFSHVPPCISFCLHDEKVEELMWDIRHHLKWKLSTITPVVVRKTLSNTGFRLIRKTTEWIGTWGKHMKSIAFKTIKDFQKINHFPGTFQIGRKDRLWKNLHQFMIKFGKDEFGFIPRTYVLPQDLKLLRQAWEKKRGKQKWIIKPPASARGVGIKVINKWAHIPKRRPLIVQKYVAKPYLINGSKFDLRLYVLITSVNPLRVYLYEDGLVRFASVKYSSDPKSLSDRYMHLTNYSINKNSSLYTHNEDASACQGHKWTLKALWMYLRSKQVNVDAIWNSMVGMVIKTLISGESSISLLTRGNVISRYCCYELFGFDILLDEKLKPWLLEVNISPSLHSASPLDLSVKGPLIRDLLNIARFHVPNKIPPAQQAELLSKLGLGEKVTSLCLDKRLYTTVLSKEERVKHCHFQQNPDRKEYVSSILNNLLPDDVRHLIQAEDELTQAGTLTRIFPTAKTHKYLPYFEQPRYYNMLFDAWETRYHSKREEGVALLERLCQEKVHLQVTPPTINAKLSASQTNLEECIATSSVEGNGEKQKQSAAFPERMNRSLSSSAPSLYRAKMKVNRFSVVAKPPIKGNPATAGKKTVTARYPGGIAAVDRKSLGQERGGKNLLVQNSTEVQDDGKKCQQNSNSKKYSSVASVHKKNMCDLTPGQVGINGKINIDKPTLACNHIKENGIPPVVCAEESVDENPNVCQVATHPDRRDKMQSTVKMSEKEEHMYMKSGRP